MLRNPAAKYRPATTVNLPDRTWPSRQITRAPRWMRCGKAAASCGEGGGFPLTEAARPPLHEPLISGPCSAGCGGR